MKVGDKVQVKKGRVGEGYTFIVERIAPEQLADIRAANGDHVFGYNYGPRWEDDLEIITPCPYPLPPAPRCTHCGGNGHMRVLAAAGLTAHNLCVVRAKHGRPTPSLGDDVVPTEPNKRAKPGTFTYERAYELVCAQIGEPVLRVLVADYMTRTGSCVWHSLAVVVGTRCYCYDCDPKQPHVGGGAGAVQS